MGDRKSIKIPIYLSFMCIVDGAWNANASLKQRDVTVFCKSARYRYSGLLYSLPLTVSCVYSCPSGIFSFSYIPCAVH